MSLLNAPAWFHGPTTRRTSRPDARSLRYSARVWSRHTSHQPVSRWVGGISAGVAVARRESQYGSAASGWSSQSSKNPARRPVAAG